MDRTEIEFPPKHAALRDDVHMLGALVGEVLRDQGGDTLLELVERDRTLAIARRRGDMEAGRALGVSNRTLIWRYLTLNCISTISVFLTLRFGQVILVGSALGFLGMGAQPPTAELGMMASQGRDFLFMAPHIAAIPSLAIFVIVLAANLLGDAVRDILDPRLQQ